MSFQEIKKPRDINYFLYRKFSTFHAFRPKAVNENIDLAGLLACCSFRNLPVFKQWFTSEVLVFNTTTTHSYGDSSCIEQDSLLIQMKMIVLQTIMLLFNCCCVAHFNACNFNQRTETKSYANLQVL